MGMDENGISDLEWERYYNADNTIFTSMKKVVSELNAVVFLVLATNLFFLVRFFYQHYFLKPLALSYNIRKSNVPRFLENGWYSLYYITFQLFGTYVYMQEGWSIFPTMNIWIGWPVQPFTTLFRTYYLLELSFYLHCTIALFFETRRKDFYQMLTHHITTFFLVGASYWYRYHRIGLAILWIHNISDIFLYSAKALNYIQKETKDPAAYFLAEMLFVGFAVTFFFARLLFLPFVLVRSTLFEAFYVSTQFPLFYPTNVALVTLLILHLFWFYLVLRIVFKKFQGGQVDDIRSDSDEEEPTPKQESNTKAAVGLEAEKITKHLNQRINAKSSNGKESPKKN
ncbi:ceramide synthase [Cavenderia fasciculata]|uniref:Ceramide synthase n=1 Tax=Cavenderia fasciculata TaxID=261658 RepID=F4Q5I5_CACFS|nr:ceramide synthase [Cavenderia fasciculata]EGG17244.1 ceramide synthase [Cavenderia fasciculata]|eukprot:XP_004355728.1 ceramide synthase [Cavenderia fasciculata]